MMKSTKDFTYKRLYHHRKQTISRNSVDDDLSEMSVKRRNSVLKKELQL